jgi:hypothetical protein
VIRPGEGYLIAHDGTYPLPGCAIVTRDEVVALRREVAVLRWQVRVLLAALWLARQR